MADLAHDVSGLASSEPAGQANPPASSDKGKLRVFISYSRDDLDFADQLAAALDFSGFECSIDREGISGGEAWKRRLGNLISEADEVVFVLSPNSARSEICAWEVEEAARLNKRILPVICRPLEGARPPPRLGDLNYIFFYKEPTVPGSGFGTGLANSVTALNTDFDWLREHNRYLQRATEWDTRGRPANRLLSGDDIAEAKAWAARRPKSAPEPTALHLKFIRASEGEADVRLSEQRKQLEAVAAAQAEREKAQNEREEAFKQAADAQRRRARVRNIAFVVVTFLAVVAGFFGWIAETQREQADDILARATSIIAKLQSQMDKETEKVAFALFQTGADHGDTNSMVNLGRSYGHGRAVTQDYAKAREWYEKAAVYGHPHAMLLLGGLYLQGYGVAKDYGKAREWYEKAAAKGEADAMYCIGGLYLNGYGVAKDYGKAREWYEKAAAKGDADSMANLGRLYENGLDVAQDFGKAREWYEQAAAKDNETAKMALEELPINEAAATGLYAEALRLQEAFAAKVEAKATREGKTGAETAYALRGVAWYALFAQDFQKALAVAERTRPLLPDDLSIETNRAHALMFTGHDEEAKALYLAHKGEVCKCKSPESLWEQAISEDFKEFRKAGLTHPMMADIEKELGISR